VVRDYYGEVMKIGEYAQFCTTVQMNKAIPLLLSMNEKMSVVVEKQDQTISEIRGLRGDLAVKNSVEWQTRIEKDIRVIKSKLQIR
jgi:hypothetical protein